MYPLPKNEDEIFMENKKALYGLESMTSTYSLT